jgi:ketosteroid isomerase-like protein
MNRIAATPPRGTRRRPAAAAAAAAAAAVAVATGIAEFSRNSARIQQRGQMQDAQQVTADEVVHRFYAAFFARDRQTVEALLSEAFTFSSPRDDQIGKAEYFERCWPNSGRLDHFTEEQLAVVGSELFLRYTARRTADGISFRNVENIRVEAGKIVSVDVYFGRDLG